MQTSATLFIISVFLLVHPRARAKLFVHRLPALELRQPRVRRVAWLYFVRHLLDADWCLRSDVMTNSRRCCLGPGRRWLGSRR